MTERSGYVLETLREGREFTLYRGRQHGNPSPVLAVALAAERPSPRASGGSSTNTRSQPNLIPSGRPACGAHSPRRADDARTRGSRRRAPGWCPCSGRGQPLELTRFLRLAPSLATALGQVHRHGMIHKDIKPANVFVDDVGNVRLTGFGIASRLPHECQAPAPPEVIAGTLAYMAPEQTGRMNRSIDSEAISTLSASPSTRC